MSDFNIDNLLQQMLMRPPIIEDPYLVRRVERLIYRTYSRPRRGRDKRKTRVFDLSYDVPDRRILYTSSAIICHPIMYGDVVSQFYRVIQR
jgi:hypothetical protein